MDRTLTKENQSLMNSLINEEAKIPCIIDLYKEIIGITQIEKYKQEDYVIRELVKGTPISQIVIELQNKHPSGGFSRRDVEKFIERSEELNVLLNKEKNSLAKRWLKAKTDLIEELAQLAAYTKNLIPELRKEKDNNNTLKAIVAFQNIIMNYAQLEGVLKRQAQINTQVNVNLDKIEQLRERAHKADFVVDVNNGEIPISSEPENEGTNS